MGNYTVNIQELKAKVETLRNLNAQFKNAVGSLESTEANLAGMWEGEAKASFHSAFLSDKEQMNNFYNTIEAYAQKLEVIISNYIQAEAKNLEIANTRTYK